MEPQAWWTTKKHLLFYVDMRKAQPPDLLQAATYSSFCKQLGQKPGPNSIIAKPGNSGYKADNS